MPLLTVGLNHYTAPLLVREAVAFPAGQFAGALSDLLCLPQIRECAILSTCNRTELYAILDEKANRLEDGGLRDWLCSQRQLNANDVVDCFYVHRGREVVRHSLRVACGLDSMILGEPQILGQMKRAYRSARSAHGAGPLLSRLFEHSFTVAKAVRSGTDIGANPVSVAYAGITLARQIFANVAECRAMLIGAGETIELTARYLADIGVSKMIFANRSVCRAQELATRYDGYAIALADVPAHLAEADLLISSTAAPGFLVRAHDLGHAVRQRLRKPMFVLDLAVPRDIEPASACLEDIYLYSVDDLQSVIDDNKRSRAAAAVHADEIIESRIDEYLEWVHSLQATDTIRAMRNVAEDHRAQIMEQARQRLARGESADAVLEFATRRLTNKLMHKPSAMLRTAKGVHQMRLLGPARELFGVTPDTKKSSDPDE